MCRGVQRGQEREKAAERSAGTFALLYIQGFSYFFLQRVKKTRSFGNQKWES